jgi:hypothetical protein
MWSILPSLPNLSRLFPARAARLRCFHCDESMSQAQSVAQLFDGSERQVCCHGCAAVLDTVQQNGLVAQYWAARHE